MVIQQANLNDIPVMLDIYDHARAYQIIKGQATYAIFNEKLIENGIHTGLYHKIVVDEKIAAIFLISLEDELIWQKLENYNSVYIHRIANHPDFKGRNLMQTITDFAIDLAKKHNRQFIRLDTWNRNEKIKKYYQKFGFKIVGTRLFVPEDKINPHYWGETCVYMELEIK